MYFFKFFQLFSRFFSGRMSGLVRGSKFRQFVVAQLGLLSHRKRRVCAEETLVAATPSQPLLPPLFPPVWRVRCARTPDLSLLVRTIFPTQLYHEKLFVRVHKCLTVTVCMCQWKSFEARSNFSILVRTAGPLAYTGLARWNSTIKIKK